MQRVYGLSQQLELVVIVFPLLFYALNADIAASHYPKGWCCLFYAAYKQPRIIYIN